MTDSSDQIEYSDHYTDGVYEYRDVSLPPKIINSMLKPIRLMTEIEWRSLGINQSRGWVHFYVYPPEPHILFFRRPLPKANLPPLVINPKPNTVNLPPIKPK